MISESVFRSGSAPPTVEGSLSAAGGLFGRLSEEEMRSDPAYMSYYYSNVNLNPRLPPPLLSREEWRAEQGRRGGSGLGGIGDGRMGNGSRVSEGLGFSRKVGGEWSGDGLIGLPGLGSRQRSIAEIIQGRTSLHCDLWVSDSSVGNNRSGNRGQVAYIRPFETPQCRKEDMSHAASVSRHPSRSVSRNSIDNNFDESLFTQHQEVEALHSVDSQTYASALGASLSRSITPDPQLVARIPSPRIAPIGRMNTMDKRIVTGPTPNSFDEVSAGINDPANLVSALSNLSLSTNGVVDEEIPSRSHQNFFPMQDYKKSNSFGGSSPSYSHNLDSPNSLRGYGFGGYPLNPGSPSMIPSPTSNLPPLFENAAAASLMGVTNFDSRGLDLGPNLLSELQNLNRAGNCNVDPVYLQYLRRNELASAALDDPTMLRERIGNSYSDLAYIEALLLSQKAQYGLQYHNKTGNLNNNSYHGNPRCGMSYPFMRNSPMGSCGPGRFDERNIRFPSGFRNMPGGMMGSWHPEAGGNLDEHFMCSLLDEFKSNKTRCFELSEIAGHVVEFSADQYGSRFIQQKLETATAEEINMVFDEIMPQALSLMTDVFGNYVVQKFFEHGTPSQIRELANQLIGNVLTFSLQMYGCRVIQKAIEVVELDLQKEMVAELDGHIMRCIRDQNGNHVIQKCIECVPEDAIQFIITVFYDQVVTLSTHPYGCRVIQRVLEHCHDPKTQIKVMDEIMRSVCSLAQDQYGNYVVQHVLEHGKPEERTAIINKLIGKIVHMSQQKFASNVIEKCLTFGTPSERQTLVIEMLGTTDENDPLQVMMKDQFANYVVQKVLETCDDQQLESILNRIKDHLNTLKKYTYGKHIVARVEKLVIAGERRISVLSSANPA